MLKIKRYSNRIERFLRSDEGQRFFNIAYSVGAAIVIWGALFKILHLPGGNLLLCIGMGTEILMFILTAFDRPPKEVDWEEVMPALGRNGSSDNLALAGTGALTREVVPEEAIDCLKDASDEFVASFDSVARQMSELSRHISAISSIYELQLRDISAQLQNMDKVSSRLDEIRSLYEKSTEQADRYSKEAQRMAENMSRLNAVYEGMIRAMSVNPSAS